MSKLVKIREDVKESLDRIKRPGQTYSGIIEELIQMSIKWSDYLHAQNPNLKNGKRF